MVSKHSIIFFIFLLQYPPPLCMWHHWIGTKNSQCATNEIEDKHRLAWENFNAEEEAEEAAANAKATEMSKKNIMRSNDIGLKTGGETHGGGGGGKAEKEEEETMRKEVCEAERGRKRGRPAHPKAMEEHGCRTGKWPR
jgi:hypothetical protein